MASVKRCEKMQFWIRFLFKPRCFRIVVIIDGFTPVSIQIWWWSTIPGYSGHSLWILSVIIIWERISPFWDHGSMSNHRKRIRNVPFQCYPQLQCRNTMNPRRKGNETKTVVHKNASDNEKRSHSTITPSSLFTLSFISVPWRPFDSSPCLFPVSYYS